MKFGARPKLMKLGIPIHVDSRVKIGHMKTRPLTEALYDELRAKQHRPVLSAVR